MKMKVSSEGLNYVDLNSANSCVERGEIIEKQRKEEQKTTQIEFETRFEKSLCLNSNSTNGDVVEDKTFSKENELQNVEKVSTRKISWDWNHNKTRA